MENSNWTTWGFLCKPLKGHWDGSQNWTSDQTNNLNSLTLPESNDSNSISTRNELESLVNIKSDEHMMKSDIFTVLSVPMYRYSKLLSLIDFLQSRRYWRHVQIHWMIKCYWLHQITIHTTIRYRVEMKNQALAFCHLARNLSYYVCVRHITMDKRCHIWTLY